MATINYGDGFLVTNASTSQGPFSLLGGKYAYTMNATGSGFVALQLLSPDGVTLVPVTSFAGVTGYASIDLPPGEYQLTISSFTAVYATVVPIPNRK